MYIKVMFFLLTLKKQKQVKPVCVLKYIRSYDGSAWPIFLFAHQMLL